MAKQVSLKDALELLGSGQPAWLEALDQTLGAALLLAAPASHGSSLTLLEPKNEALRLLTTLTERLRGRLNNASQLTRSKLISSVFAIATLAAFFDELSVATGLKIKSAKLSRQDQLRILTGQQRDAKTLLEEFGDLKLPTPDQSIPYSEFRNSLHAQYSVMAARFLKFFSGLSQWDALDATHQSLLESRLRDQLPGRACARYESHLLEIARVAPEIVFWINLHQHVAAAADIQNVSRATTEANRIARQLLVESRIGLHSVERALNAISPLRRADATWTQLAKRYQAEFRARLIEPDEYDARDGLNIPGLDEMYIPPAFRVTRIDSSSRPSEEAWWSSLGEDRDDLEEFIAGYLASTDAVEAPLIVLGHPGAGKSVLMKALAARLSTAGVHVMRVDLRHVAADAPIISQIESALKDAISRTVEWGEIADSTDETMTVVLLDGFDELLQGSATSRSDYIEQIKHFQRSEALRGRPIVSIVTTRTVVANRARIPAGCLAIHLEPFDLDRIELWLDAWGAHNSKLMEDMPELFLTIDNARTHVHIAQQPLLLLMLAIYIADGNALPADDQSEVGHAYFYESILMAFARREVLKTQRSVDENQMRDLQEIELDHLSIAAFSMFNRGAQYVSEKDLDSDLSTLVPSAEISTRAGLSVPPTAGQSLVGRFFFIHVSGSVYGADLDHRIRTYEFLHATFGEYLIARIITKSLRQAVKFAAFKRQNSIHAGEDLGTSTLAALLSFQVLAQRRQTISFLAERLTAASDRDALTDVCVDLFRKCFSQTPSAGLERYRPIPVDIPTRLAYYSANLVTILAAIGFVNLASLFPDVTDPGDAWSSLARYWQSRFNAESWASQRDCIALEAGEAGLRVSLTSGGQQLAGYGHINQLRLSNTLIMDDAVQDLLRAAQPLLSRTEAFFVQPADRESAANLLLDIVTSHGERVRTVDGPAGVTARYLQAIAAADSLNARSQDAYLSWILRLYAHDERALLQPESTLDVLEHAEFRICGVYSLSYLIEAGVRQSDINHPAFENVRKIIRRVGQSAYAEPKGSQLDPTRRIELGIIAYPIAADLPSVFRLPAALNSLGLLAPAPASGVLVARAYFAVYEYRLLQWARVHGMRHLESVPDATLARIDPRAFRYVISSATGTAGAASLKALTARWKAARSDNGYPEA